MFRRGGSTGKDFLDGGEGDDNLYGGNDADTFAHDFGTGSNDKVWDFSINDDRDCLVLSGVDSLDDVDVSEDGLGNTVLSFGGSSITLIGIVFNVDGDPDIGETFSSVDEINGYSDTYDYQAIKLAGDES